MFKISFCFVFCLIVLCVCVCFACIYHFVCSTSFNPLQRSVHYVGQINKKKKKKKRQTLYDASCMVDNNTNQYNNILILRTAILNDICWFFLNRQINVYILGKFLFMKQNRSFLLDSYLIFNVSCFPEDVA